jgi:2-dehydropantoate 2-reductase
MLQDVLAGRRTELEELTGAFLSLASDREAQVPTHRAFYTLLSS